MNTHKASRHLPITHAATPYGRFGALRSVTAFFMAAGLFISSTTGFIYRDLVHQVADNSIDASAFLKDSLDAPPSPQLPSDAFEGRALNILIANIDSRYDQGTDEYGDVEEIDTIHSDATMVAHISADRTRIQFVSIPRDLVTDIPSCINANNVETSPYTGMFNSSFSTGAITDNTAAGIACTQRATEYLTGLSIDAFVLTDFRGFTGMVNALGGIWYYFDEPVNDDTLELYIPEGCMKLDGSTALAFSRARYGVGDGSDLSRIGRQQKLVAAMLRELFSKNFVTEFPSVLAFVKSSLQAVNTSPNLSDFNADMGLLLSLSGIERANIQLMTMPTYPNPDDHNRVLASEYEAEDIWRALRNDEPFPAGSTYTDGNGMEVTVPEILNTPANPDAAADGQADTTAGAADAAPADDATASPQTQDQQSPASEAEPPPSIPQCPPKS